jgi:hypothetical protein
MQAGHVGNRTVARGDVWGVVVAATRAFPIQLSPSVDKAHEVVAAAAGSNEGSSSSLLHTWILQVGHFASSIHSQQCLACVSH